MGCFEVIDVRITYPSTGTQRTEPVALDRFSIQLEANAFGVVIGPHGCGKSSLMNAAAGLTSPRHGQILLDGLPLDQLPRHKHPLVFDNYNVFPWMTVFENIQFALTLQGLYPLQDAAEKTRAAINLFELNGYENSYPEQITPGVRQKTALARAFVLEPKLLILDEPFYHLNTQMRLNLQQLLHNAWIEHPCTILYSTHDLDEAILLATDIFVMSEDPGPVREHLQVTLGLPRSPESMIHPEFIGTKQRLISMLLL